MKKLILITVACLISVVLFVGCRDKSVLKDGEEIKQGDIYKYITSIDSNIKIKFINDPYKEGTLEICIPIKKDSDKKESEEFNKISDEIFNKIKDCAKDYEEIKDIEFYPIIDNNYEEAISTNYKKNNSGEFELYGLKSDEDSFKILNGNYKDAEFQDDDSSNEDTQDEIVVPYDKGEFTVPKSILQKITPGSCKLQYSKFYLDKDGENKIIKIDLNYDGRVMTVGVVKKIRNNIENIFKEKCNEIDLTIVQQHPMDLYECKYINGSWDKEVK